MSMRGKKSKSRKPLLSGDGHEPGQLRPLMVKYLEWMALKNFSGVTIKYAEVYLRYFAEWAEERGIKRPGEVSRDMLDRYHRHVFHLKKKNGSPLGSATINQRLVSVRGFFKWAARNNLVLINPAAELELPRRERGLPKLVPSPEQMERILCEPDLKTPLGVRDRAILEVLYSTGMRRMELCGLLVSSIGPEQRTVMIRKGKGKKDRVVPIGERALAWVEKYLADVRPELKVEPDNGAMFLSATGGVLGLDEVTRMVGRYIRSSGVSNAGSCHAFRHAMATAMLSNGADLRCIQEILGHEKLDTTRVYTRLSIERLKEVHAATHPAAKLNPPEAEKTPIKPESEPEKPEPSPS